MPGLRTQSAKAGPVGAWRSLVAHLHGVQVVGGSNPLAPTNFLSPLKLTRMANARLSALSSSRR